MQHTGREEGQNVDKECADVQHCMWYPSKNIDAEEHHVDTEVVWSKKLICQYTCMVTTVVWEVFAVKKFSAMSLTDEN